MGKLMCPSSKCSANGCRYKKIFNKTRIKNRLLFGYYWKSILALEKEKKNIFYSNTWCKPLQERKKKKNCESKREVTCVILAYSKSDMSGAMIYLLVFRNYTALWPRGDTPPSLPTVTLEDPHPRVYPWCHTNILKTATCQESVTTHV